MQKGHNLQFDCLSCKEPVHFSVFNLENNHLECQHCNKCYVLDDPKLQRQLQKFEALCQMILDCEEILADTMIGIDMKQDLQDVKIRIPYRLLMTRFNSSIDLTIGGQPVSITFRIEPSIDLPNNFLEFN